MNNQEASERARETASSVCAAICMLLGDLRLTQTDVFEAACAEIEPVLTAAASEARAAERERLGFGQIVMMSEQRDRPGQPPRWCALARGSKVAVMGDTEEEARLRALATPAQSPGTGWKISDETAAELESADNNLRDAPRRAREAPPLGATSEVFKIPPSLRPIRILQDKFEGQYSGGRWIAYVDNCGSRDDDVWNGSRAGYDGTEWRRGDSDATVAGRFWGKFAGKWWIAVGDTPNDALTALLAKAGGETAQSEGK